MIGLTDGIDTRVLARLVLPEPPSANRYWRTVLVRGRATTLLSKEARAYRRAVAELWPTLTFAKDLGGRPIDVKTKVMDGTELDGLDGLRDYLVNQRRDAFLKQFCRKLLGYSLGRGVLLSDGPLINEMREQLQQHDFKVSAAIETIVRSQQFREIRGKAMAGE